MLCKRKIYTQHSHTVTLIHTPREVSCTCMKRKEEKGETINALWNKLPCEEGRKKMVITKTTMTATDPMHANAISYMIESGNDEHQIIYSMLHIYTNIISKYQLFYSLALTLLSFALWK